MVSPAPSPPLLAFPPPPTRRFSKAMPSGLMSSLNSNLLILKTPFVLPSKSSTFEIQELLKSILRHSMNSGRLELTLDKRHNNDCIWFLAKESPINAMVLPLTISRNQVGSRGSSSQPSGCHLHFM